MQKKYLTEVYGLRDPQSTKAFYDDWAGSYEAELAENRYATPARVAAALTETQTPLDARILDYGCGTGLSGEAFVAAGYTLIDGTDLSPEMLAEAEAKQIYGRLFLTEPGATLSVVEGSYDVIAAVGVVGPGAAPVALLQTFCGLLAPGGRLAFSYNDHALGDAEACAARDALDAPMRRLHDSYGDHLPGIGLNSAVYVYEKT